MTNAYFRGSWRQQLPLIITLLIAPLVCLGSEGGSGDGHSLTHAMTTLMMQLAVIIVAAKLGGMIFQEYLKIPSVLGELAAGVIISPYALGPHLMGLFPMPVDGAFPISNELYGIATLASIILLYLAGLETDLGLFLRFSLVGTLVGVGGVVVSFGIGAWSAVAFGLADSYGSGTALFLGTISTATSVGITARILGEKKKLHTPEGVTILAGAVVDDVLGIVVLAIVIGIARTQMSGAEVAWGEISLVAGKAFGFWLVCTALGLLLSNHITRGLRIFKSNQDMAAASLGLALLLAGLAEHAGLAMILGAYIMGLSLSRQDCASELIHRLEPMHQILVSVFFCVMGMLVNLHAMQGVWIVGLIYTAFAILAKVVGCAIPPLFLGFNKLGAFRVGIGMLPRGEVALIVAGIGLAAGVVEQQVFGIAIMMTLVTTFIAPLVMVRIFDNRLGLKIPMDMGDDTPSIDLHLPSHELAGFLLSTTLRGFRDQGCYVYQLAMGERFYKIRDGDVSIALRQQGTHLSITCRPDDRMYAEIMLMESIAHLRSVFGELGNKHGIDDLRHQLIEEPKPKTDPTSAS